MYDYSVLAYECISRGHGYINALLQSVDTVVQLNLNFVNFLFTMNANKIYGSSKSIFKYELLNLFYENDLSFMLAQAIFDPLFTVTKFTDYIKGLSPSSLDLELRMLHIIDDELLQEAGERPELHHIELLLDYFIQEITRRSNFEFVQAVVRLFLKVYATLAANSLVNVED